LSLAVCVAAVSACVPPPNPYAQMKLPSPGTPVGISGTGTSASTAGATGNGSLDTSRSQSAALTKYLKSHRLPLVRAQVVSGPAGQRKVILFGFVATDFGKRDAAEKTRKFLRDPNLVVDNRIKVSPELAASNVTGTPPAETSPENLGNAKSYEQRQLDEQYQYQQQQSPDFLTTILPLLLLFGAASLGTPSFGTYGGFGTYGYPSYPASPGPTYPAPSSRSPYAYPPSRY